MKKIETMKNIILGVLCGTIIALVCTVIRLDIELEEAERLLDDPVIRFPERHERYKEYERARQPIPVVPDIDYRIEQMLNLAAENPNLFTDEEIVYLLIQ